MKIFTHESLSLDAAASIWAVKTFVAGAENASVVFVDENWRPAADYPPNLRHMEEYDMDEGDLAIAICANGRGLTSGEDPETGFNSSCLSVVLEELFVSNIDHLDLLPLLESVEEASFPGNHFFLSANALNTVFRGFKTLFPQQDELVLNRMLEIFSGMWEAAKANIRAKAEAEKARRFRNGTIVIVEGLKEPTTKDVLFSRGAEVVIYSDGSDLGAVRSKSSSLNMAHPRILEVLQDAGEFFKAGECPKRDLGWFIDRERSRLHWGYKTPPGMFSSVSAFKLMLTITEILNLSQPSLGSTVAEMLSLPPLGSAEYAARFKEVV